MVQAPYEVISLTASKAANQRRNGSEVAERLDRRGQKNTRTPRQLKLDTATRLNIALNRTNLANWFQFKTIHC